MRRRARRIALVGVLGVGMAVVAGPSGAAPPPDVVWQVTAIDCTGTFGERELMVTGYFDEEYVSGGGDAEFHDPTTEPVTVVWGNVEQTSTYDGQDFVLDVTFTYGQPWDDEDQAAAAGEPGTSAGTMTITGTATPSGEPATMAERIRDGNTWVWWSRTTQLLAGAGSITTASGDVGFTDGAQLSCSGHIHVDTFGATEPATYIARGSYSSASCPVAGPPESFLRLAFFGTESFAAFGIGVVDGDVEAADWWAFGPIQRSGAAITGDLEVYRPSELAGEYAHLALTVGSPGIDRGVERLKGRQTGEFERWVEYPLTGTLALPDGSEVAIGDCTLRTAWTMFRYSEQAGQKPGGKPPVNDLPTGALALAPGTVGQSTRGAALEAEAPCLMDTGEGVWVVPFGRTVWYSLAGTGDDVTLSTLGTSQEFDTALAVYQVTSTGTLDQVVCATEGPDPKQGWAAEATVATAMGETYLVQVGGESYADEGLDPAWGDLVLTRS